MAKKTKWEFRDISAGLQMFRSFVLGREHKLHNRFPPALSPRTIPPPDVPRTFDYKYSNQWYMDRHAYDSVKPPVVAPAAVLNHPSKKSSAGGMKPGTICFNCAPTPGPTWWWDGHCYYEPRPEHFPPTPSCESPDPKT